MIVYSTVYSRHRSKKTSSSASLAFVRGIHRWPVSSPHKGPVTRKCFHSMMSSWYFDLSTEVQVSTILIYLAGFLYAIHLTNNNSRWIIVYLQRYKQLYVVHCSSSKHVKDVWVGIKLYKHSIWRSFNITYQTFMDPCIRHTDHLCDSCRFTDVIPHFIL